jgi:hypothetical protein
MDGADVEGVHDFSEWHVHYVGRGGIAAFAISAIDIALWDLRGKAAGQPLWKLAGGAANTCDAYSGGIDLAFPLDKLLDNVRGYLAKGVGGVKIKIGRQDLEEDIDRIRAVRQLIGDEIALMVDANYAMSVDQAIAAAKRFSPSISCGSRNQPFRTTTGAMRASPPPPVSRWQWARTCTRFTSSSMRSSRRDCPSSNRTPRIAAASRAG